MKRVYIIVIFYILLVNLFAQIPDIISREDDRLAEQFVDNWIEESWFNDEHHVYGYNGEGLLIEYTIYTWTNDEWQNYKHRTYCYDENDLLTEMIVQNSSSGNWINYQRYTYLYNENDLQSDYYYYLWENDQWQETNHHYFVYDENLFLIEHYKESWSNSSWELYSGKWLTNNTNGQVIESLQKWWFGYWVNNIRCEYSYNSYGDIVVYQLYVWELGASWWMLVDDYTYEYEYVGGIKQWMIAMFGAYQTNEYKELYSYDNNNLIETILQDWDSGVWINDMRTTSIYESTEIQEFVVVNNIKSINIYPNPFNPSTAISFSVATPGIFALEIYNIKGEKVTTLLNKFLSIADYNIIWHGKDDKGSNVASGIYFGKLSDNNHSINTTKMLLLK